MTNASLLPELVVRIRPGTLKLGKLVEVAEPATNASPAGSTATLLPTSTPRPPNRPDQAMPAGVPGPLVILVRKALVAKSEGRVLVATNEWSPAMFVPNVFGKLEQMVHPVT